MGGPAYCRYVCRAGVAEDGAGVAQPDVRDRAAIEANTPAKVRMRGSLKRSILQRCTVARVYCARQGLACAASGWAAAFASSWRCRSLRPDSVASSVSRAAYAGLSG